MGKYYVAAVIAVVALVTILLRFIPFVLFGSRHKTPRFVMYLGSVLPYAIMGMLVVYCLKHVTPMRFPYGLPELIAGSGVVLLHLWKRNTLLSITLGTVCYMILIQFVFS